MPNQIGPTYLLYLPRCLTTPLTVYKAIATALDYPPAPPAGTEMSARLLTADGAVRCELEV